MYLVVKWSFATGFMLWLRITETSKLLEWVPSGRLINLISSCDMFASWGESFVLTNMSPCILRYLYTLVGGNVHPPTGGFNLKDPLVRDPLWLAHIFEVGGKQQSPSSALFAVGTIPNQDILVFRWVLKKNVSSPNKMCFHWLDCYKRTLPVNTIMILGYHSHWSFNMLRHLPFEAIFRFYWSTIWEEVLRHCNSMSPLNITKNNKWKKASCEDAWNISEPSSNWDIIIAKSCFNWRPNVKPLKRWCLK